MTGTLAKVILCAVVLCAAQPATASVIDFNSAVSNVPFTTYSEDGFVLTNDWSDGSNNFAGCSPACANDGTRNLYLGDGGPVTLARTDGGPFALLSFDLGELFQGVPEFWSTQMGIQATFADGGGDFLSFVLDGLHSGPSGVGSMQTVFLPSGFVNLTSITFWDDSLEEGFRGYTVDNIVVSGPAEVSQVPEPGTLLLLASGVAMAVGATRRRRSVR